jgi:hypothetical protein
MIEHQTFSCLLMDRWKAEARAGDPLALEQLIKLLPRDVPAAARVAYRAACIRQIGTELRGAFPDAAEHRIATLIESAGNAIEQGRGLPVNFQVLDPPVRDWIEALIRDVLSRMPTRANGSPISWHRGRRCSCHIGTS